MRMPSAFSWLHGRMVWGRSLEERLDELFLPASAPDDKVERKAERENFQTFKDVALSHYSAVVQRLSEEEVARVYRMYRSLISADYGYINQEGQWIWLDKAAIDVFWAASPSRRILLELGGRKIVP